MAKMQKLDVRKAGWAIPLLACKMVERLSDKTGLTLGAAAGVLIEKGADLCGIKLTAEDYDAVAKEIRKNMEARNEKLR